MQREDTGRGVIPAPAVGRPTGANGRIRLLKFVATFGCGGTERQFVKLAAALEPARFDLAFGCLKRWGAFLDEIEGRGILLREYRLTSFRTLNAFRQQLRLARDIARRSTEIVHTYNFDANVFAIPAAYLAGTPVIIASIRDRGAYLTPAKRRLQRLVCRLADCVLVNAESIREWLIADGYDASRIVLIPNGLDTALFQKGRVAGTRESLGVPADARLVVMMSRLTPVKGIEDFIDAAPAVAAAHPDVRFLMVGAGHTLLKGAIVDDNVYERELMARAAERGVADRFTFTGYRSDIPAVLAEADVSVLPSLTEGLSNVILESMAAGVPVVATRVGGTPELIEDGVTGVLVPAHAPDALAQAINRVLDDQALARQLGRAAQQSVIKRYSTDRMVSRTSELYRDLLRVNVGLAKRRHRRGWLSLPRWVIAHAFNL